MWVLYISFIKLTHAAFACFFKDFVMGNNFADHLSYFSFCYFLSASNYSRST